MRIEQVEPPNSRSAATLHAAFDSDPTPIVDFLVWLAGDVAGAFPPRVLDVGCGVGRLLPSFVQRVAREPSLP